MRVEYINPFVEAAYNVLKEMLEDGTDIKCGEFYLENSSMKILGVAVIVGLAGNVEGRVMFDMSQKTALKVAGAMNAGEIFNTLDNMAKATLTELANIVTAQAVSKLHDIGFKFDLTPPALFSGENMEIAALQTEALVVPIELGANGVIKISVAVKERV
ncbi:MAG: chemotaxis protein CheX [Spirochaetaceae bacterium]|jgi:chemotaxis protein CheX|nr:chemotaxis protein CheX [Spirochaetaceae bacterium]